MSSSKPTVAVVSSRVDGVIERLDREGLERRDEEGKLDTVTVGLAEHLAACNASNEAARERMDTVVEELSSLKALGVDVAAQGFELSALKQDVCGLKKDVVGIKEDIGTLNHEIGDIKRVGAETLAAVKELKEDRFDITDWQKHKVFLIFLLIGAGLLGVDLSPISDKLMGMP